MKITVVYNNIPCDRALETKWGFSALIEGLERTILFDTGGDSGTLLSNMEKLGIDPGKADIIFLSHVHMDHTGGLEGFLEKNSGCVIYFPRSFPDEFRQVVSGKCEKAVPVDKPVEIFRNVWSTGELGRQIKEQSLVIDTDEGLILMAGCAHPGIVNIAKRVRKQFGKDIRLLIGGFHLEYIAALKAKSVIRALKKMGVRKVAPSHCNGEWPIKQFKEAWGEDFVDLGCGGRITVI